MVQLAGALTSSQSCSSARTSWMSSSNASQFTLNLTTGSPVVQITIGFSGKPTVGQHYTIGDGSSSGTLVVTGDTGKMWDAHGSAAMFDLSFTAVTPTIVSATGQSFAVDGALTATLAATAGTGASGTIMLDATF